MSKSILMALLFLLNPIVWGSHYIYAQVDFYARVSKEKLSLDERLKVEFVWNQKEDQFIEPPFENFNVIMSGTSRGLSWINGKHSVEITRTYILQPKRTGILQIEPAKLIVDGKEYQTNSLTVEVTEVSEKKQNISPGITTSPEKAKGKDIFLNISVTKDRVYENEALGVIYSLYVKQNARVVDFNISEIPDFKGFWSEVIREKPGDRESEIVDGVPYWRYPVYEVMLIPQKPGEHILKPIKAQAVKLELQERQIGFFSMAEEVPVRLNLTSGRKKVSVKPLPRENKPDDFSGAVGSYTFEIFTDTDTVRVGEDFGLHVKLNGQGNFNMFELPEISLPPDLEVFEPEVRRNYKATLRGYKGNVEKIYSVIPQRPGKYVIPSVGFTYFDPKKKTYVRLRSEEKILEVLPAFHSGGNMKNPPKVHTEVLMPLAEKASWTDRYRKTWFERTWVYVLYVLAIVTGLLAWGYKKIRDKRFSNPLYMRKIQAQEQINKYLREAEKNLGDKEKYYAALENAIRTYLTNALDLKPVEVIKEGVLKEMQKRNVPEKLQQDLLNFWNSIEVSRYMPGTAEQMHEELKEIKKWIREMNKSLER